MPWSARCRAVPRAPTLLVHDSFIGAGHARHALENGVLTITSECTGVPIGCYVEQDLTVPPGVPVRVDSGAGDVTTNGLDTPRFEATAGASTMRLDFARPPDLVVVRTGPGNVDVRVPDVGYRVEAGTGIGSRDVSVRNDRSAPRTIDVSSAVGNISIAAR